MNRIKRLGGWKILLLLPVLVLLGIFIISVLQLFSAALIDHNGVSLKYFYQIVERDDYQVAFLRTLLTALVVAALSVILGYPIALLLWRAGSLRNSLMIVVLVPWLVSLVVRTYGWMVVLGPKGFINEMAAWAGLIDVPLKLMFNDLGVVIGLTHVLIPFAVISTLSALLQIDPNLEEASRVLGGNRWETFRRIVLPLSLPGVFTGIIVIFLATMGAIVTPILLGGIRQHFAGTQIYQEVVYNFNLNKASAWSISLLTLSLSVLVLIKLVERRMLKGQEV